MKRALIITSVSSMIDQFNIPNIQLLLDLDYEVHVACNFIECGTIDLDKSLFLREDLESKGVSTHQINFSRNPFDFKSLKKAYSEVVALVGLDFDILHSQSPVGGAVARVAFRKQRKFGLKSIYTAHGFHFFKGSSFLSWLLYYPLEYFLSNFTDTLITINSEDYNFSKNRLKARTVVHLNGIGVDLNKFIPVNEEAKNKLRKQYNFSNEDIIFICVAEINKNKNQTMVLDSMIDLFKENLNLHIIFIGNGPLKQEMTKKVDRLNLKNNVHILGYRTDVKELMSISDFSISASQREGLPVNIIESMASGLPVIASDCRGNKDLVVHNKNGLIFNKNDLNSLKECIKTIISDKEVKKNMALNSRLLSEKYSVENIMEEFKSIY